MTITDLKDKKCLITGAASGIGRAVARAAAVEGAELFLTDINSTDLAAVAAEVFMLGGKVGAAEAFDIASYEAVKDFADRVHAQHGSLDVVMNIAGISVWGTIENLQHAQWRKVVEINLMGPIHVMETFLPPMIQAGKGGHLVNVASAAGLFALPWHAAYSASKFGLRGISEVLRFDLAQHGIGVSLVCPGGVDTPLVGTVEIEGVDRNNPRVKAMIKHFQRHAVTPEQAATAIIKGIKRRRFMVFTSADIRIGYWFQRKFAYPYELVMRLLNRRISALARSVTP